MEDEDKVLLHEQLIAYLIQSAHAMAAALRALATDRLHASSLDVLTSSLESAKVILSKVSHQSLFNPT